MPQCTSKSITNMPPPPKQNAYHKNNKAILKAVKTIAENNMVLDDKDEIHALKGIEK